MFQLDDHPFNPQPVGNLIKSCEYRSLLSSQELLEAARKRSEEIVVDAQQEWQRQHAAGYKAGMLLARESAVKTAIAHHQHLIAHLKEVRGHLTEVILQAVTKIIGELPVHEAVGRIIEKALAELVGQNRVTLLVHPDNLTAIDQLSKELREVHGIDVLELQSDPQVPLHACVISTPKQVIDASLEVQLGSLRQLLTQQLLGSDESLVPQTIETAQST